MLSKTHAAAADARAPLLAAFLSALPGKPASPPPEAAAFVAAFAADYRAEEMVGVALSELARQAAELWTFAEATPSAETAIRIRPARDVDGRELGADLVEIVQPDAPFLVDSVMAELVDGGGGVMAMFHPLIRHGSGLRSVIQVWLEPLGEDHAPHIVAGLKTTLADVRLAVGDFEAMATQLSISIAELRATAPATDPEALAEDLAFLEWLSAGHFVFLGARTYEYPRTQGGGYAAEEPTIDAACNLGVLRDPSRPVLRRGSEPAVLSPQMRRELARAAPLVVAKSNLKSVVHRRVYMDYVGLRRYAADGKPSGEVRFVGLFTAQAYDEPARAVPLIRRKVTSVMTRAGLALGSHNEMRLANILETYPRDELFQIDEEDLLETALGVLHLSDRPRVKLFTRRDPFDRFVSILFYAPRERYDARLREEVGRRLAEAFGGRISAYYPNYSDAPLARVHYIIGVTPGRHAEPDVGQLERAIAELARTWSDDFEAIVRRRALPEEAAAVLTVWDGAFPPGYRDRYGPAEGLADLAAIGRIGDDAPLGVRAFRHADDSPRCFRLKVYRKGAQAVLTDVLPILEDMGLMALAEDGFPLAPLQADGSRRKVWVHEFELEDPRGERLSFEAVRGVFEEAFLAVWTGQAECDGFNRLVLELAITWRQAALIRALARYRLQSGLDPSAQLQQQALSDFPEVAALILELFAQRLDPTAEGDAKSRAAQAKAIEAAIEEALQAVESLDADRVLRRIAALVGAIQRTNFYQAGPVGQPKPYISFKVASRELQDLPDPKPYREIFVASPAVEGVHLRLGPVARGGLRWSDRRDDFRTEVLGLVKAQQVKNAVIVPVGSKGGFFPKRLPKGGTADETRAAAVEAYKTFLDGLLDLTDNIGADGSVIHPPQVLALDGDDPYLVVAADKGTATFSDIANGVAQSYGFWLGDAFASGGSAGYDHKAMGITARGAWEGVKRHFRELGKDIQSEPFSVVGVGDMSGDVFGNGMLLSKQIQLFAAFDHRHVFLDPDPDAARSWAERQRLFALPRSSWDDYDKSLISEGGGVFPRTAKSVVLTPQVKALLDLKPDQTSMADLIGAILKARVELIYLGGIGTYVKGAAETNLQVGDKANDAVRIDGRDLRCKVVGEGANLGFTQAGRIEYALAGGRIDTDAIDNSAGVDTSDHEVNIKILTGMAERAGALKPADRDALLASMTDDIAAHVLSHNYDQTLALSVMESRSVQDLDAYERFMVTLEGKGRLDRALEGLPSRGGGRRARPRRQGPHPAGAGGAAGLRQARPVRDPDRLLRAGRSTLPDHAQGLFSRGARPVRGRDAPPPPASRDHRHGARQRHGQPLRTHLPRAVDGGGGLRRRRPGGGVRGRAACAALRRSVGAGRGARRQGADRRPDRVVHRACRGPQSPDLLAGAWAGQGRARGRGPDRHLPARRGRSENTAARRALGLRAEGRGAPRRRLDQGRRAQGPRPQRRPLSPADADGDAGGSRPRGGVAGDAGGANLPRGGWRLRLRSSARRGRLPPQRGRLRAPGRAPADRGHAGRAGGAGPRRHHLRGPPGRRRDAARRQGRGGLLERAARRGRAPGPQHHQRHREGRRRLELRQTHHRQRRAARAGLGPLLTRETGEVSRGA